MPTSNISNLNDREAIVLITLIEGYIQNSHGPLHVGIHARPAIIQKRISILH